nr:MAG TPA: hypothetical protein [Caudoviricetes sp.]
MFNFHFQIKRPGLLLSDMYTTTPFHHKNFIK